MKTLKIEEMKTSKANCDFCYEIVNAIDLELTQVPLSKTKMWACDDCRGIIKQTSSDLKFKQKCSHLTENNLCSFFIDEKSSKIKCDGLDHGCIGFIVDED
jgi:ribosomal protein L37AE/L43A